MQYGVLQLQDFVAQWVARYVYLSDLFTRNDSQPPVYESRQCTMNEWSAGSISVCVKSLSLSSFCR
jgi:hypothetical protein